MTKFPMNKKGSFSLIGMLIVLGLICFFTYYIINLYFSPRMVQRLSGDEPAVSGGNSAPQYQSIISHTRDKVEELNKKSFEQMKQIEELK